MVYNLQKRREKDLAYQVERNFHSTQMAKEAEEFDSDVDDTPCSSIASFDSLESDTCLELNTERLRGQHALS